MKRPEGESVSLQEDRCSGSAQPWESTLKLVPQIPAVFGSPRAGGFIVRLLSHVAGNGARVACAPPWSVAIGPCESYAHKHLGITASQTCSLGN